MTNYARTGDVFAACLDYIFLSPDVVATRTRPLPTLADLDAAGGPLPTLQEPSDHLMIAADLVVCETAAAATAAAEAAAAAAPAAPLAPRVEPPPPPAA